MPQLERVYGDKALTTGEEPIIISCSTLCGPHQPSRFLRTRSDIASEGLCISTTVHQHLFESRNSTRGDARHHSRQICFLRKAVLGGCDVERGQYSCYRQPYARASEGGTGTASCSEAECLVWESRCAWGEPAFRIEPVWFREDRRIVKHCPRDHRS